MPMEPRIGAGDGRGVTHLQQTFDTAQWDFRSPQFRDQALALARMTGCPFDLCRQELFIAEGDAVEAFMVLEQRRRDRPIDVELH